MILYLLLLSLMLLAVSMYKRYYPVQCVPCIKKDNGLKDYNVTILDIKDYTETVSSSNLNSLNIPYAYLKRFYQEIPHNQIHVIAADKLEKQWIN